MKITRGEGLLLVAIVTSAVVAQVREHTLSPTLAAASVQTQTSACNEAQSGMLRAGCGIERKESGQIDSGDKSSDRAINRAEMPRNSKVWV